MFRNLRVAVPPMLAVGLLALAYPRLALGLQLSDLLVSCRVELRDSATDANFQRFSDATLAAWINEGQRDAQNKTWILQGLYNFTLVSAQRTYQTPADFLYPVRVVLSGHRLTETNFNQLDSGSGSGGYGGYGWSVLTSTPTQYYLDSFVSSPTMMGFYPCPASASQGAGVWVQYAQIPAPLAAPADVPFDGKLSLYAYHDLLVHYCAMKGWQTVDRNDMASGFAALYAAGVATAKMAVNQMPDFNPGAQGYTGPPGQR